MKPVRPGAAGVTRQAVSPDVSPAMPQKADSAGERTGVAGLQASRMTARDSAGSTLSAAMPHQAALMASQVTAPTQSTKPVSSSGLPFDEEAKLVYGVVFSLKNIIRKLSSA